VKAHKITENVYADTSGEGRGNIGAIELQNYTIAVDTTMFPQTAVAFRHSLESQIKTPIRKLILTHCHADHVFGNQVFKGCEIISSKPLKQRMEELAPIEWTPKKLMEYEKKFPDLAGKLSEVTITFPTATFEKTMTLKDGDLSVTITHSGGHTEGTSYLYFPKGKILFSGDLIFAKSFPWGGDKTCNPDRWIETLKQFLTMDIERIVPGHGPLCGKEEVKIYLEFFESTTSIMKELIQKNMDEREIAQYKGFPAFYPPHRPEAQMASLVNWYSFYKQKAKKRHGWDVQ